MEPGPASIGYAVSILVPTPMAIALIYLVGLGARLRSGTQPNVGPLG